MKLLYFFLGPDTLDNKILLVVLVMELGTIGLTAARIMDPAYLLPAGGLGFAMLMAKTVAPLIAKWASSRMPETRIEADPSAYDPNWRRVS